MSKHWFIHLSFSCFNLISFLIQSKILKYMLAYLFILKDIKKAFIFRFEYKRSRVIGIMKIKKYKVCIIWFWYYSKFNIIQCKVIYVNKCWLNIVIFNHLHKSIILFVNFFKVIIINGVSYIFIYLSCRLLDCFDCRLLLQFWYYPLDL